MVLIGFGMTFVGSQVQALVFAAIIPRVSADFGASDLLVWFFCVQQVATAVIAPFAGSLADLFGRKRITIAGVLSSMLGMIVTAATPSAAGYLAGQVFAGMGVAVQELMAIAAIVEIVPTENRGYYIAIVVASFFPFAPGSLYGALIAQTNWRYCACMIAIWNFITALIIGFFYNPPARQNGAGLSLMQKFKRIDFVGGSIMTVGLVLLLVGLNCGQQYSWDSPRVIACLTVGIILLIVFLLYEKLYAPFPMFPGSLLRYRRTFMALMVVILLAGINYVSLLIFWVLEAVAIYDSNQVELGVRTIPYGFCIMGGAIISAVMVSLFKGHLRSIMTSFCVVQTIGIGCMAAINTHNISTAWAPLIFSLLGIGGVLIPNQIIVTIICPDDLIATATCLTACLRAVGQVIGTSIFYTQFVSALTENTYKFVVPAAIRAGVTDFSILESIMGMLVAVPWKEWVDSAFGDSVKAEGLSMLREAVLEAFEGAFCRVWYISIGFGVAAVLASLCIEDLTNLMDGRIAVRYF
ncbi:fungal trichothecene efflux pump [Aspergillus undulatus]|uniref:fungal trichothecene efflux pump n=1 Tax=Aspergillus undulatus TaxID=1810928 RepID=UPI003CCDEC8B